MTDESIHLASAFQLAGYRHVIVTLWPIHDRVAVRFAEDVYDNIVGQTASFAAYAVHQATRRLRTRWPDNPQLWAAHIHTGA